MRGSVFSRQTHPLPTKNYTLSLHDALPILRSDPPTLPGIPASELTPIAPADAALAVSSDIDRKSTRLNSSHPSISYAVFCLKKKNAPSAPANSAADSTYRRCEHGPCTIDLT